jgi:hypothetical protein
MAENFKHIDYLKKSALTYSDLNDKVNAKLDSFENVYKSYENAFDNNDKELIDKYNLDLDKLDDELVKLIQDQEQKLKEPKKEEVVEEKKVEEKVKMDYVKPKKEEVKDETPIETTPPPKEDEKQNPQEGKSGVSFFDWF